MATLSIHLLGPPHIELNGQPIELNRRKALALLAYLAVTGQSHRRDSLAALLWPELDQSRARAALRRELSVLNTTLGDAWFETDRDTVQLLPAGLWLDVSRFQQLAAATDSAALAEAAELYRDDFLAGFTLRDSPDFDDWQFFQAETLRQQLASTLRQQVAALQQQGNPAAAIPPARRWLALDPLHEPAHRSLMSLYAAANQRSAALRQYQECQRLLADELGLDPAPETSALFEQIRAARVAAPAAPGPVPPPAAPALPDFLAQPPPASPPPFVAREQELTQLEAHLAAALSGEGRVICITGEAGSGKTALAHAFIRQAIARHPELLAAGGNCNAYTGLGDPYLPFREILRLLTGDLETRLAQGAISPENARRIWAMLPETLHLLTTHGPQLINTFIPAPLLQQRFDALLPGQPLPQPPPATDASQTGLFEQFTGLLLALAAQRPLLLLLDDAQWADAASVNLLFHLSRRLPGSRVLLLVTYRPGDIAHARNGQRHPLEPVVNEIRRSFGPVQVDLSRALGQQFVEALIDVEPNHLSAEFRAALYRQTQGHPLFTVELLRDMQVRGDLVRDAGGRWVEGSGLNWERLPARVEAVIAERIDRLDGSLRELLTVASVQGESFTAQVLAQVQHIEERPLLRALSVLEREYRLIQERGEIRVNGRFLATYRFTHTLFQQYLYRTLSAAERRLLHGDVAAALAQIYHAHMDDVAVPLGLHYMQAGQPAQAIPWLLQAGDRARGLYAHEEAVGFYRQALTLLKEAGQHDRAARTLMKLGLTHHMAFEFAQARAAYDEGFALWQLAGSQPPASPQPAPHPLRLAWTIPPTLDPALAHDDTSAYIVAHLFSGLVRLSQDMDVVPELAYRWEMLDNGGKYRFYLRDDFAWSDGVPVTAEDFVYAWQRALNPAQPVDAGVAMLFDIKGARDYFHGLTTDPADIGLQALGPYLLEVELDGPTSYFLQLLTQVKACPVPRHVVERFGPAWTLPENIVSNGPFFLEAWQPDSKILLGRNPRYPGDFGGNLQQVELRLIEDELVDKSLNLYAADELDVVALYSSLTLAEQARQRHAAEYFTGPMLNVQFLGLNIRQTPLDDERVRRALAMSIDRERVSNFPLPGYHFPGTGGFIPPGMPEHSPDIGLPYDPEQARQLLAGAGFAGGQNFPVLTGLAPIWIQVLAEQLSRNWRENLGITVTWQFEPWKEMLTQLTTSSTDMFLIGWRVDYPDPDNLLRVSSHRAWAGWHNPAYVELIRQARRVADHARRVELYQQADKILIEDAAIVPLVYGRRHLLIKPWVSRLPTSAVDWHFWKDVVIKPH